MTSRWIRLLFGREFPFDEVLIVWDLLMSENLRPELIDIVCITMILRIRWQCKKDLSYDTHSKVP